MPDKLTDNLSNNSPILANELSDSEIVKALEYCIEATSCIDCNVNQECDGRTVLRYALDLINRLQAKNSNLTSDLTSLQNDLTSLRAENERLSQFGGLLLRNGSELFKEVKTAKAEAYKEFVKRLHEELRMYGVKDKFNKVVFLNVVDKAKKELVGEDK